MGISQDERARALRMALFEGRIDAETYRRLACEQRIPDEPSSPAGDLIDAPATTTGFLAAADYDGTSVSAELHETPISGACISAAKRPAILRAMKAIAKPFVYLGGVITFVGFCLAFGNMSGMFPTFPFAGFVTIGVGGGISQIARAVSRGELEQEIRSRAAEILAEEHARAFRMETSLRPWQAVAVVIVFSAGLAAVVYVLITM